MGKILFITGAPRSGTTMVRRVLQEHPEATAGIELRFFDLILAERMHPRFRKFLRSRLEKGPVLGRIGRTVEKWHGKEGKKELFDAVAHEHSFRDLFLTLGKLTANKEIFSLLVEKTPHNALFFNEIRNYFPNAYFLFLVRDGREVVTSATRKWGTKPLAAAAMWVLFAKTYERDIKSHEHIVLKYEDVVENPKKAFSELFSYVGFSYKTEYAENIKSSSSFPELQKQRGMVKSAHVKEFFSTKTRMEIEYFMRPWLVEWGYPLEFSGYSVSVASRILFYSEYIKKVIHLFLSRRGILWVYKDIVRAFH